MSPEPYGAEPPAAEALPAGFLSRMQALLGPDYPAFAGSYAAPRLGALRWNPQKVTARQRQALDYAAQPVPWAPEGRYYDLSRRPGLHPWHDAGAYYLQEPSAMAPAGLLDPQPGERVLDLCAAPGGKATQLAAALGGQGLLVANELVPARARVLSRNLERWGAENALVTCAHPAELAARLPGYFHRVLVDAPCSGEGMFRKEPDAVADWSERQVEVCAARQLEILLSAARMTAPGGRLVYSTCTFAPLENEGVVSRFLEQRPDFSLLPVSAPWFAPGRPDWVERPAAGLEGCARLWPHLLRGEGHFAAVLQRSAAAPPDPEPAPEPGLDAPKLWTDFAAQVLPDTVWPAGRLLAFGETWYLSPAQTPALGGLKVLRAGLELGSLAKNRFQPAHALALWLHDAPVEADYPALGPELARYLRGETLPGPQSGWTLVKASGLCLGWAKGSQGVLKNHYPKGLRR